MTRRIHRENSEFINRATSKTLKRTFILTPSCSRFIVMVMNAPLPTSSRARVARNRRRPLAAQGGFTIVELLIVIVVIAILAAIVIVAYAGIQQRATNASVVESAGQATKTLAGYIGQSGNYPDTGQFCMTLTSGCLWSGNAIANSSGSAPGNITAILPLPASTPRADASNYGVVYNYTAGRTLNGTVQPLVIVYFLVGNSQKCGLPNVTSSGGGTMFSSASGYTATSATVTTCVVSITGP